MNQDCKIKQSNGQIFKDRSINQTDSRFNFIITYKSANQLSCVNKCATNVRCNVALFDKLSQQCSNYAGLITNETQFIQTVGVNTIKMTNNLRVNSLDQYCKWLKLIINCLTIDLFIFFITF